MNDFSELEAELKKIRPAATSADLMTRIERGMKRSDAAAQSAGVVRRSGFHINWLPLGLGLAAATAFLLLARVNAPAPSANRQTFAATTPAQTNPSIAQAANAFVPAGVTQVVYNTRDEGLMFANGADEPVRRVRSHKRETLRWKNPGTGASLEVSYPSEEIKFIPVPGQ